MSDLAGDCTADVWFGLDTGGFTSGKWNCCLTLYCGWCAWCGKCAWCDCGVAGAGSAGDDGVELLHDDVFDDESGPPV
uniref:Uncharacterized protein n=1 Tax=Pararge aegeria TaxID=116150 RepID=S4P3E4_9NEOP